MKDAKSVIKGDRLALCLHLNRAQTKTESYVNKLYQPRRSSALVDTDSASW